MDTQKDTESLGSIAISALQIGILVGVIDFLIYSIYIIFGVGSFGWYQEIEYRIVRFMAVALITFVFDFYRRKKRSRAE